MNWQMKMLGSTVSEKLTERAQAPLLRIGKDIFRRGDFAKFRCFTFQAASTLSTKLQEPTLAAIMKDQKVKDTRDLFLRVNPNDLAIKGLGHFALAALGAAFQAKGLGSLDDWDKLHGNQEVTWSTVKHREAALQKAERNSNVVRHSVRRKQAHEIRVTRFTERRSRAAG